MKNRDLLRDGLAELNLSCTEHQISSFMTYLAELRKWNRAYNLTAIKSDADIIIKHFLDSLLYVKFIPEGALDLADIGAGAGFPGLPIRIIRPELRLSLIESSRKKSAFLRHICRKLGLTSVAVLEQRAEDLHGQYHNYFDVIVSRATFSIKAFLEIACPCAKENGSLILSKGPKLASELKDMARSDAFRYSVQKTITMPLPLSEVKRNLIMLSCKM